MLDSESFYIIIFCFRIHRFQRLSILERRSLEGRGCFSHRSAISGSDSDGVRVAVLPRPRHTHVRDVYGSGGGREGEDWKKKGSAKRLNAPLSSLRERTRMVVSENARLPCTVGLEF